MATNDYPPSLDDYPDGVDEIIQSCEELDECQNKTLINNWLKEALTDSNLSDDVVNELKSRAIVEISKTNIFTSYFFVKLEDDFETINLKCLLNYAIANSINKKGELNYCADMDLENSIPENSSSIEPIRTFDILNEKYEPINLSYKFITDWRIKPTYADKITKGTVVGVRASLLFNYKNSCCIEYNKLIRCEDAFKKLIRYYVSSTMTNNHDIQPTNYEYREAMLALESLSNSEPNYVSVEATRRYW